MGPGSSLINLSSQSASSLCQHDGASSSMKKPPSVTNPPCSDGALHQSHLLDTSAYKSCAWQPPWPHYRRAPLSGLLSSLNSSGRGLFDNSSSKYPIQFAFTQDFPGVMPNEIINDDYEAWPASLSQRVKRRKNFCSSARPSQVLIQADPLPFSSALNHMCCNNHAG